MTTIRIRTRLESDTPHLPELKPLIGREVEIVVREEPPADDIRAEFYAELARLPDTDEALAAHHAIIRQWRADPRFTVYWPYIDQMKEHDLAHYQKWAAAHEAARIIREEGGIDSDAIRDQDECDRQRANDHA